MRLALTLCVAMLAVGLAGCSEPPSPSAETLAETIRKTDQTPASESAAAVYRFAKISSGAYFYTGDRAERDSILASLPDFRYEGVAFLRSSDAAAVPVYRFANLNNGGYFYTANPAERDLVIRAYPHLRFEGSTFAVAAPGASNTTAIYRLANLSNGAYLLTSDPAERAYALGLGFWRDEGIAFQAATHDTPAGGALAGRTWGAGVAVDADAAPVLSAAFAPIDNGQMVVAFQQSDGTRMRVFATIGTPGEAGYRFTAPVPIDRRGTENLAPITALDTDESGLTGLLVSASASGNAAVAWLNAGPQCLGINFCARLFIARYLASTGRWEEPLQASIPAGLPRGFETTSVLKINDRGDLALVMGGWSDSAGRVPGVVAYWRDSAGPAFGGRYFAYIGLGGDLYNVAADPIVLDETGGLLFGATLGSQVVALRGNVRAGLITTQVVSAVQPVNGQASAAELVLTLGGRNGHFALVWRQDSRGDQRVHAAVAQGESGTFTITSLGIESSSVPSVPSRDLLWGTIDDSGAATLIDVERRRFARSGPAGWSAFRALPDGFPADPLAGMRAMTRRGLLLMADSAGQWSAFDAERGAMALPAVPAATGSGYVLGRSTDWTSLGPVGLRLSLSGHAALLLRNDLAQLPTAAAGPVPGAGGPNLWMVGLN
jgi:hypothetical protein